MSISDVLKTKLFWGATTIFFVVGCRLVWWTWIFLLSLPIVVEDTFGCREIKFRNVSASDISPMSGTCVNLLASIRMLLFLTVVECQSRLNGKTSCVILSGLREEVTLNEEEIFQL